LGDEVSLLCFGFVGGQIDVVCITTMDDKTITAKKLTPEGESKTADELEDQNLAILKMAVLGASSC
jgi:hypothetical protein